MSKKQLARVVLCVVLSVGAGLGITRQVQARVEPETDKKVYLWKDLKGGCPATCDNNQYSCPCVSP